ncbi:MAG: hypothetical protein KKB74_05095, partial [Bacteroidetes bacterium]|nr:hypothetical protein [Bacteroidota bacterium]
NWPLNKDCHPDRAERRVISLPDCCMGFYPRLFVHELHEGTRIFIFTNCLRRAQAFFVIEFSGLAFTLLKRGAVFLSY